MSQKFFFSITVMVFSLNLYAQIKNPLLQNLDVKEDTANITTVKDIVAMQQNVLSNNNNEKHNNDIWRRRSFFNISKNSQSLESKNDVLTENGAMKLNFKSNWGVGLQSGVNYRLHKKPIANMVNICLDYSWLDLNVHHFKAENDVSYDSRNKQEDDEDKYYMPWRLEKYEANYGMSLGPSVTVAPFVPLNVKELHYIKLQLYYHIGYNVSWSILNAKDFDVPQERKRVFAVGIRNDLINSNAGYGVFEDTVRSETWERVFSLSGLQLTTWSIIYWCLLFMEIKF